MKGLDVPHINSTFESCHELLPHEKHHQCCTPPCIATNKAAVTTTANQRLLLLLSCWKCGVQPSYCICKCIFICMLSCCNSKDVLLQARERNWGVTWAGPILAFLSIGNVTISPALNSTAYAAALAVYGISAPNAQQAQGECSKHCALMVLDTHITVSVRHIRKGCAPDCRTACCMADQQLRSRVCHLSLIT